MKLATVVARPELGSTVLQLVPKKAADGFQKLFFAVDAKTGLVQRSVVVDAAKDRHFGESAALHRWPVDMQRWSDQQMLEQLERIERQLGTQPELSPHSSTLSVRPTPQRPHRPPLPPERRAKSLPQFWCLWSVRRTSAKRNP